MLIPKVYATAFVVDNSRKSYIHNICTSQHMLSVHICWITYRTIFGRIRRSQRVHCPARWKKCWVEIVRSREVRTNRVTHHDLPARTNQCCGSFLVIFAFFFISLGEKMRSKQSNFFLRYYLLFCIYYLSIYKYKCLNVFFFFKSDLRKNLRDKNRKKIR